MGRRNGLQRRNDEIRDNITRMRREWEAQRDALATVRRFNARLSAKGYVMVLAQDRRRAHFKASLVGHQLRQLWDRGGLRLAREAARPGSLYACCAPRSTLPSV